MASAQAAMFVPAVDPRIGLAIGGDRAAAQSILKELLPRFRNLVRFLVRTDADVDDLAQQACVEVLKSLRSFRGEGTLEAWACRIAARVARAHLRRSYSERERRRAAEPELASVRGEHDRPDRYLERRRVAELLDELPTEQREVLVLHHVLGLSVPELAEELAIPMETARSRLRLGMGKLRRAMFGDPGAER